MATTTAGNGFAARSTNREVHESDLNKCSIWTFWWVRSFMWSPLKRKPVSFRLSAEQTCEPNATRLLALCNTNTDGPTATRIVLALCGWRLLLANILYIAAFAAGLGSTVYCMYHIIDTATQNHQTAVDVSRKLVYGIKDESGFAVIGLPTDDVQKQELDRLQSLRWLFSWDFVLYLVVAAIWKCAMQSILLREATILRAACIGALYRQTVQSSVRHGVQSHEINAFLGENADALSDLVRSGALLASRTVAICGCVVIGALLLGVPVLWYSIAALLIAVVLINYGRMHFSGKHRRESHRIWAEKCELVDDVVQMAKTTQLADSVRQTLATRFSAIVRQQMAALCRAELLRPTEPMSFVILILMAIVHLISWPFINTSDMMMFECVAIMLMITLPTLLFEWNESLVSLILGLQVVERTQLLIRKLAIDTPNEPTTTRTDGNHLVLKNVKFATPRHVDLDPLLNPHAGERAGLHIRKLELSANSPMIIGITGKSNSTLYSMIAALLDDRTPVSGRCNISTTPALYPEYPYLLDEQSVWHNTVLGCSEWREERFQQCLSVLGLDQSADFQTSVVEGLNSKNMLQKIALTRALYNEQQRLLILENPLIDSVLFAKFIVALKTRGRSAIVLSRSNNVLRQCDLIHVLHDHELGESRPYEDCAQDVLYQQCIDAPTTAAAVEPVAGPTTDWTSVEIPTELSKISVKKSPFRVWLTFPYCAVHLTIEAILAIYIGPGFIDQLGFRITFHYSVYIPCWLVVAAFVHVVTVWYVQRRCRSYNIDWHERVFGKMMGEMATESKCRSVEARNLLLDDYATAQHWTIRHVYRQFIVGIIVIKLIYEGQNMWQCVLAAFIPYICVSTYLGPTIVPMLRNLLTKRQRLSGAIINDLHHRLVIQSVGGVTQAQDRIYKLLDEYAANDFVCKSSIVFARFLHEVCHYLVGFSMLFYTLANVATTGDMVIRSVFWMVLVGGYWNVSLESEVLVAMRNVRLMKVWAYIGDSN